MPASHGGSDFEPSCCTLNVDSGKANFYSRIIPFLVFGYLNSSTRRISALNADAGTP